MKRPAFYLCLLAVGMAGVVAWTIYRPPSSGNDSSKISRDLSRSESTQEAPRARESPAKVVSKSASAVPAQVNEKDDILNALKRRLDDSNQRGIRLRRAKAHVEQSKGRLFQRLRNVPPEKLDQLKVILAETELAMERGALPTSANSAEAEAAEINDTLKRIQADSDHQVQALLDADDYAIYAAYQGSNAYRNTIEQVTNVMRARGSAVSDDLQEAILDGYAGAIAAAAKDSANDITPAAFRSLSKEQQNALRQQQLARFDGILAASMVNILSPAEYQLFMDAQFTQETNTP
ncbi:MAG: hypothetical protein PHE83_16525 [Opitutaceae bacterium]|nr:hypothetical protein [Opitutaceae bacterium]